MYRVKWAYLSLPKIKKVRKSRFYSSKNYTNPFEHQVEILGHCTHILQKELCEYLLISHANSFLNIHFINILYTNIQFLRFP